MQTLEGKVSDWNTKKALANVEVRLMRGKEFFQSVKTDENGQYKFVVEAAAYDLSVCKEDYVLQTCRKITVWEGLENQFDIALTYCRGLCNEDIYNTPRSIFRPNETGTGTRFSANELRGSH
jgi:hypothetical protein